ncbi:MAG: DUF1223 domain-containing protein [Pseudomonadota bacterium]
MKTALLIASALLPSAVLAQAAASCSAQSGAQAPAIVELYTSEGCSSCPPADRWLSTLKGRNDVIALAFHVNYWDRLGWPDRFATPAATERQHQLAQSSGSGYVYTPQVVLNGRDWRQWSGTSPARLPASTLGLGLKREGNTVTASVGAGSARLAGYWAVLEDGHNTRVRAGENAGETLKHDHVVTLYQPVDAWPAKDGAKQHTLALPPASGGTARRIVFVVTDAATQRPLQALALAC